MKVVYDSVNVHSSARFHRLYRRNFGRKVNDEPLKPCVYVLLLPVKYEWQSMLVFPCEGHTCVSSK
jgi:hypothetical protein